MAKNKNKSDSKDAASKNTFNPPGKQNAPPGGRKEPDTVGREVGQYTGNAVPSNQNK